jgi:transmembrane sensor
VEEPLNISSEQLARYVSNEADAAERALVERWAASDPAHRRELEAMSRIWSMADGPEPTVDVDTAWQKVKARMEPEQERGRVIPLWSSKVVRWAAAAAVLVGLFFVARIASRTGEETFAETQPIDTRLSDSSHVYVSPHSRVQARIGDERHIELQGQAWFEVARDEQRPFIVEAEELKVTVLGTGFEVSAYDTAQVWRVRVRHGRVRVEAGNERVELAAGERITFDRKTGQLERSGPVTTEAWGDRIIQFENAPLAEVVTELQRIYHVRVDLGNTALQRCRLTATFENESVQEVLQVIAGTFGLRVVQPATDRYALDGEGC